MPPEDGAGTRLGHRRGPNAAIPRRHALTLVLALLLLNAALTFDNLWPTPGIVTST